MQGTYLFAWDSVTETWIKVAVTAAGKIKVATS